MTARRGNADYPNSADAKAAATREARGSVQEAIGKLIGDDAVREQGRAERKAGAADAADIKPARGPDRDDTHTSHRS